MARAAFGILMRSRIEWYWMQIAAVVRDSPRAMDDGIKRRYGTIETGPGGEYLVEMNGYVRCSCSGRRVKSPVGQRGRCLKHRQDRLVSKVLEQCDPEPLFWDQKSNFHESGRQSISGRGRRGGRGLGKR